MPMVLFFPKDPHTTEDPTERCTKIKTALSETLTKFYPLAGRIRGIQYVDCNDEGAYYVEAKANSNITDIIQNPCPSDFNMFIPCALDAASELPICLQVTFFACGGMSVGMGMSHKVGDALSFFIFLNSLAATTRGEPDYGHAPELISDKYFPQQELSGSYKHSSGMIKHNVSTKRFVFDASAVSSLRARSTDVENEHARRPTHDTSRPAPTNQQQNDHADDVPAMYTVSHAVNLRTRTDPPLPEYTFGNVTRTAISVPPLLVEPKDGSVSDPSLYSVVRHVRQALKQVDREYVKKLQEGEGFLSFLKERSSQVKRGEVVSFSFTSLCRFPIYDADFGWGKPVYAGSASFTFKNLVSFFDTTSGDGVEAWINLKEEDMENFEADEEVHKYVSPNPSSKNSGVKTLIY
ncbi:unnamed protein product [Malus baccata var. baccata]